MKAHTPSGCRYCGIAERPHARQWTEEVGWHSWTQPTTEQIKDRMRARGTVPPKATPGTPATEPIYCGMCLYGSDVGVPGHDGKGPAYINPECPDHNPEPAPPVASEEPDR